MANMISIDKKIIPLRGKKVGLTKKA